MGKAEWDKKSREKKTDCLVQDLMRPAKKDGGQRER